MLSIFLYDTIATFIFCDVFSGLCCSYSDSGQDDKRLPMIRRARHVPSKPGRPVAKCDDGIHMNVEWTQPEDNGGDDITGYVIKYGDKGTSVDDYATVKVDGNTTNFTFTDQLKGTYNREIRYQFAVAAENTVGQGEFSEFSDYVSTGYGKY